MITSKEIWEHNEFSFRIEVLLPATRKKHAFNMMDGSKAFGTISAINLDKFYKKIYGSIVKDTY